MSQTGNAPDPLAALAAARQTARDIYGRGALDEAMAAQRQVLADAIRLNATSPDDHLFFGLMLYAAHRLDEGIALLRECAARFPDNPAVAENLGVFLLEAGDPGGAAEGARRALELGSDSPNVHDCLCDALSQLGRLDEAVIAGRHALEAKDRRFGGRAPLIDVPTSRPQPFNPGNPAENVIAYCLWGDNPRYLVPMAENVRIAPHLFPGWTIRLYHDNTVPQPFLLDLAGRGVQLQMMMLLPNVPVHRKLLWRFEVIADPTVRRFLVRDADSLLSVKERVAVDAWLQSRYWFHAMRDWYTHTDLLLAGMWGGVGNMLPAPGRLIQAYTAWRVENNHVDQDLLTETVWPIVRNKILIHDSIFAPCLGSVPFPPYGHSAPGSHVGQNAFMHFKPG